MAIALIAAILVAAFFAMRFFMSPPGDIDLSRTKLTGNGIYRVTIAPESGPVKMGPLHSWVAEIETADGAPVADATIAVDGGMPQHGHGLPTVPQASATGDGHYLIEGVRFSMGGWWELRLTIKGQTGEDDVTFNIVL